MNQSKMVYEPVVIFLEDNRDFLVYREGSGGTIEIVDIVVNSERRKGKGKRLIELLMEKVQRKYPPETVVWAITRAENLIAQQFYEKLGFSVTGVLRRFYSYESRTVDAIMYGRQAKGPI